MPAQASQFDLATAFLDTPKVLAYGKVRGAGNRVLQYETASKSRYVIHMLAEGPWSALSRLWLNRKQVTLPNTSIAHFHPGSDGVIGTGMAATSTGGDQGVDQFFASLPGSLDVVTWSRYAYLALFVAPDAGAPSADLEVLADFDTMQCRQFDSSGTQTAFSFTQNPAWWICDFLLRKFILREAKSNQPLTAGEKARFDWQSFSDAAAYYDADIGGGIKRFSDGGLLWVQDGITAGAALEQMLLFCRSYLLEINGKLTLYADKPRASVFTFYPDDIESNSFQARKSTLRNGKNRVTASFRDLNIASGSTDDATRFAIATLKRDHEAHQKAVGVRGPGLAVMARVEELQLDYGLNTPERVDRLVQYQLLRQLGDDVDAGQTYAAPFDAEWTGYENSLAVIPGDVVTIDRGISEEFGATDYEVLEVEERADGRRTFSAKQYMPNAFPDVALGQQALQTVAPGTGLPVAAGGGNFSYRPLSSPLTATDAGATATVNLAAFMNRIQGLGDLAINSGSVTALSYDTTYFVAYDDDGNPPTGGAKTFAAYTTKESALNARGRFYVGSVRTPAAGGVDTVGNNDGGAGAQTGFLHVSRPSATATLGNAWTSPGNAFDADLSTFSSGTTNAGTALRQQKWTNFNAPTIPITPVSVTLKVKRDLSLGGAVNNQTFYSTNGGSTWTLWSSDNASFAARVDSIALPTNVNFSQVQFRADSSWNSGADTIHKIYEVWIEAPV